MSLLGIDAGTTGVKAAVFSEDGELLTSAYAEYDVDHPQPGTGHLDAVRVWEIVKNLIARVCAQAPSAAAIRAVSVSSMGEAVVPVTRLRQVLAPSILNFDSRGEEFLEGLRQKIQPEQLYQINGNTLGNQYSCLLYTS